MCAELKSADGRENLQIATSTVVEAHGDFEAVNVENAAQTAPEITTGL